MILLITTRAVIDITSKYNNINIHTVNKPFSISAVTNGLIIPRSNFLIRRIENVTIQHAYSVSPKNQKVCSAQKTK